MLGNADFSPVLPVIENPTAPCAQVRAVAGFQSVLWENGEDAASLTQEEPEYFRDLNLDQVVAAATTGKDEYDLKPFFYPKSGSCRACALRANRPTAWA